MIICKWPDPLVDYLQVTGVTRGNRTEGGEEILAARDGSNGRTDRPTEGITRGPRGPKNYILTAQFVNMNPLSRGQAAI